MKKEDELEEVDERSIISSMRGMIVLNEVMRTWVGWGKGSMNCDEDQGRIQDFPKGGHKMYEIGIAKPLRRGVRPGPA